MLLNNDIVTKVLLFLIVVGLFLNIAILNTPKAFALEKFEVNSAVRSAIHDCFSKAKIYGFVDRNNMTEAQIKLGSSC